MAYLLVALSGLLPIPNEVFQDPGKERLKLAAYLGDEEARKSLGAKAPTPPEGFDDWLKGIRKWGQEAWVRALTAAVKGLSDKVGEHYGRKETELTLVIVRKWIARPSPETAQNVQRAARERLDKSPVGKTDYETGYPIVQAVKHAAWECRNSWRPDGGIRISGGLSPEDAERIKTMLEGSGGGILLEKEKEGTALFLVEIRSKSIIPIIRAMGKAFSMSLKERKFLVDLVRPWIFDLAKNNAGYRKTMEESIRQEVIPWAKQKSD